jgi:hypothetical protein
MAEKQKKESVEKRFRLLKNPNQTAEAQTYQNYDGSYIVVPKNGYHFSLDKEMDKTIDFLKENHGFVEVN